MQQQQQLVNMLAAEVKHAGRAVHNPAAAAAPFRCDVTPPSPEAGGIAGDSPRFLYEGFDMPGGGHLQQSVGQALREGRQEQRADHARRLLDHLAPGPAKKTSQGSHVSRASSRKSTCIDQILLPRTDKVVDENGSAGGNPNDPPLIVHRHHHHHYHHHYRLTEEVDFGAHPATASQLQPGSSGGCGGGSSWMPSGSFPGGGASSARGSPKGGGSFAPSRKSEHRHMHYHQHTSEEATPPRAQRLLEEARVASLQRGGSQGGRRGGADGLSHHGGGLPHGPDTRLPRLG
eukprot:TRINITY_DN46310_c0_g1_i1.p1 TRINITY_DN46310_c0_g1~~TRINITY_DN46310_c0_g1_i1.p1  ORF type:complete len:289 (+),score=57.39 TRINITY_DN46310_c0_g1_i1:151-1017(+)